MAKIDALFREMLAHKGSDLHLSQGQPPKIRVHGRIVPLQHPVCTYDQLSEMFKEICPAERWRHYKKTGDLDFAYSLSDNSARFRGNLFIQLHGIGGVFRQIPAKILTLDELQLPPVLKTFAWIRDGLVLVTGPTGSGKSTTLAGILDFVNTNYARHILTIEEPIEFIHPDKRSVFCQREVGLDCASFGDGLKASTRQDADIILVGEMRTAAEMSLAISAAAKGTLVFATLHTNSAIKTIDRIIDAFTADEQTMIRSMLADVLRGVVAQLLVRQPGGQGRTAVHEILVGIPSLGAAIRTGNISNIRNIITGGKKFGMQMMDDCIAAGISKGIIDPLDGYMKSLDKKRFIQYAPRELQ